MDLVISQMLSLFRIVATFGIFTYHFTTIYGHHNEGIFLISIYIFCFLTGYLSYSIYRHSINWLLKRFYSIMIPYWFIIIPVLIVNRIISYKETSLVKDIVTLLGGSLFIDNRVYVISWYITFVLLLYLFVFMRSLARNKSQSVLIWLLGILFFSLILQMPDFFMVFAVGLILARIHPPPAKNLSHKSYPGRVLFFLQNKCYAFFLVHGSVLLLLIWSDYLNDKYDIFIFGFLFSGLGALLLKRLTQPLITVLVDKTENMMIFKSLLPRILKTM